MRVLWRSLPAQMEKLELGRKVLDLTVIETRLRTLLEGPDLTEELDSRG